MPSKAEAQQQFHPRTPAEAREWLVSNGITVSGFARQLGVNRTVVDDLLRGRSQGKYGDSHTAAIALGLKAPPNYAAKVQTSKRSRG
ncbi:DNA-binding protein [Xanthomonas campestris pv. campestris]|uniref:DNA-binding protein n=2 Tax=Xanthomonas campestris TaxID=339 RepID=UPI001A17EEB6|nr:DNA-binding protein [Xanthomonas campestris]MBF9171782.1 DNA-binding protein [Xanthomonas campestris pv. campestris]MDO0848276.1 DNA-binding protein [Xanthomonas campestris pv. campestris]MEB1461539.1 DNA-binding protein [Xanthomonas campestris pv. campestris]MEB1599855.1 DNA-binding protein [Xanthomonas campestris pv. campestris]MEB1648441.1 DNA-binding protein [Xanthomonas campestris pv. campestris]